MTDPTTRPENEKAKEGGDSAANSGVRSQQNQQKESENRGRQHQRQSGKRLKGREPASAAQHQQRRQRHCDGQQNGRCDGCESEREG